MKKTFRSFLMKLLVFISLGIGIYFTIKIFFLNHEKQESAPFFIYQPDNNNIKEVRALILYHASDYFVHKGAPLGFQYDLLKEFGRTTGKNIEISVETNASKVQNEFYRENYDIVAADLPPYSFLLPFIDCSIPHSYSFPVLVLGNKADTVGVKTIVVSGDFSAKLFFARNSPYFFYHIQKNNTLSTEELFQKVAQGEIPYLLCDYNKAITLIPFYANVKILDKAGPLFGRCWILNKKNVQLNEDINHWLLDYKKTLHYRSLLQKYFSAESPFIQSLFSKKNKREISQYDAIIKKYATKYKFDWRFIAAIMYQETKFVSGLTGKGGSCGLMQLMPITMDYHGIVDYKEDDANICAGVQHLNFLRKSFENIEDEDEKLYWVAASYNAGRGGVYGSSAIKYAQQVMERFYVYKVAYP